MLVDDTRDLALHRDGVFFVRELQLAAIDAERRVVMDARAEHSDLENRDGSCTEGAWDWSLETETLELAPLLALRVLHEGRF